MFGGQPDSPQWEVKPKERDLHLGSVEEPRGSTERSAVALSRRKLVPAGHEGPWSTQKYIGKKKEIPPKASLQ